MKHAKSDQHVNKIKLLKDKSKNEKVIKPEKKEIVISSVEEEENKNIPFQEEINANLNILDNSENLVKKFENNAETKILAKNKIMSILSEKIENKLPEVKIN
jgi:hypothetical protein